MPPPFACSGPGKAGGECACRARGTGWSLPAEQNMHEVSSILQVQGWFCTTQWVFGGIIKQSSPGEMPKHKTLCREKHFLKDTGRPLKGFVRVSSYQSVPPLCSLWRQCSFLGFSIPTWHVIPVSFKSGFGILSTTGVITPINFSNPPKISPVFQVHLVGENEAACKILEYFHAGNNASLTVLILIQISCCLVEYIHICYEKYGSISCFFMSLF